MDSTEDAISVLKIWGLASFLSEKWAASLRGRGGREKGGKGSGGEERRGVEGISGEFTQVMELIGKIRVDWVHLNSLDSRMYR